MVEASIISNAGGIHPANSETAMTIHSTFASLAIVAATITVSAFALSAANPAEARGGSHGGGSRSPQPIVRDHRTQPIVRDHRPIVRDHRHHRPSRGSGDQRK